MGIYLVMKNNFRKSFNHKLLFLVSFLLPIVLCVIAGSIKLGKTTIRVGSLEAETNLIQREERQDLYNLLEQSEGIKYAVAKEDSLHTDLMTGKFNLVMDYRNSTSIEDFKLLSYQNEEKIAVLTQVFRTAITEQKSIDFSGLPKKGMTETERTIAVLLTMFMIISSIHAAAIIRDRQSGTYDRYHFARKSDSGYVLGYVMHNFLITYGQIVLCMVVLHFLQAGFIISLTKGVMIGVVIALISTVFSMLICLSSKSEMQANITASSLAAVLSLLGGTFVTIESMPGILRLLSLGSPIRWIVELTNYFN